MPSGENRWYVDRNERENGLVYDIDNYEGASIIPHFLVEKQLSKSELNDVFPEPITKQGIRFVVERIRVRFYNFSNGTTTVSGTYTLEKDCSAETFRSGYEEMSTGFSDRLNNVIGDSMSEITQALGKQNNRYIRSIDTEYRPCLQWVHRLYYLQKERLPESDVQNVLLALIPKFEPKPFVNTSIDKNFQLYPSIVSSACIYNAGTEAREWNTYASHWSG